MGFNFLIMKKISLLIIVLSSLSSYSQDTPGNLQFNRIVNFSQVYVNDGNNSLDHNAATFVVPEGKVWKINNFTIVKLNKEICYCSAFIRDSSSSDLWGINVFVSNGENAGGDVRLGNLSSLTTWLNSGTKIITYATNTPGSHNLSYTAIEFNIVDN